MIRFFTIMWRDSLSLFMFHPPALTQSIIPAVLSFHFEDGRFNPASLLISLSPPLSLTLSTWVSLQTWELWVPMLWISNVPFSRKMRTPAAPSTAEWFSSHSFFHFLLLCIKCWDQSNSLLQFFLQERNKLKWGAWDLLQTWLDHFHRDNVLKEGAGFVGIAGMPAQIFNQLEKSDGVQLKGCLAALLLFLFFPCSPKCWQPSSSSTPGLSGNTFPVEFC